MLQEKENGIEIVGTLSEVDLKPGTTSKGQEYLAGTITIKAKTKLHNEMIDVEIPVNVYSNKLTKKGDENPSYKSLVNVRDNMVSIASCGDPAEATYVRVYQATGGLQENTFFDKTGKEINTTRIRGSFFNPAQKDKYKDTATFNTRIFILAIEDELDRDGAPTGNKKIKAAVPNYDGSVNVLEFKVVSKQAIEHIETYWNKGDTVKVYGVIAYTSTVQIIKEEVGFGDPIEKRVTRSKKELIITSGSPGPLDDEEAFDSGDIAKALNARKAALEEKKEEARKPAKPANTAESEWGF